MDRLGGGLHFYRLSFGKDPMKRLVVRLVALSLLAVLGMFAIAQAQRFSAQSEDDSPAVVSRFSSAADAEEPEASDVPADPLARRGALGVDPRVRVIRDGDAVPAVYRGRKGDGVIPANHDASASDADDAADANGEPGSGATVVVSAGDAAAGDAASGEAAASETHPDAPPRSTIGASGSSARDYGSPARRYADEIPQADAAASQKSSAARAAPAVSSRPETIREATDAIDAAVAARLGRGARENATEESAKTSAAPPRTMATESPRSTAAQGPKATAAVAAPVVPSTSGTPVAGPQGAGLQGTGTPGGQELEGPQSPSLSLEKVVPAEIQVGKTATFEIRVQNTGRSVARDLQVVDQLPQGTRLVNTQPRADLGERGELIWNLAALEPGATAAVRVELVPLVEGQVGSVARVRFAADVSARTTVTKPQLAIEVVGDEQVMIGDEAVLAITVANPGSGEATDVILEADIPANFKHPAGSELEFEVGTLRPNESRRLELNLAAIKSGSTAPTLVVRAAGVPAVEKTMPLEVVAPKLEVGVEGPKRRFLDRKSTHVVTVSNPGTAAATDVELVAYLPPGMKFVEANNQGTYDARQHAVYWSLAELPAQRSGDVQLVTLPTESGEQVLKIEGRATRGLADEFVETISVEGVAALSFQISDLADPLAVGGQASYEVRVVNTGSKSASNVQVVAVLPAEMAAIDAKGPTGSSLKDGKIVFQPISRLAPKEQQVFQFRAEATKAGDLRVRVQLTSDEITTPITQEESTRVFAD